MNTDTDFRKSKRFEQKATVMLEDESAGYLTYGQMINYSEGGMCFGSDMAFQQGAKISVKFDKPLYKAAPKIYHGIVRWCKELSDDHFKFFYGVGIKYE